MKATGRQIELKGKTYTMQSEAWWTECGIKHDDGIEIARVHAESDNKYRSEEEKETYNRENPSYYGVNPYENSPDFNGKNVGYILSLTMDDLTINNITPGRLESASKDIYLPTHQPKQQLISEEEHDHEMFMLETEGYGYGEEIKDNTPYMKGDDMDI